MTSEENKALVRRFNEEMDKWPEKDMLSLLTQIGVMQPPGK
jgi:hypothetical protein